MNETIRKYNELAHNARQGAEACLFLNGNDYSKMDKRSRAEYDTLMDTYYRHLRYVEILSRQ